LAEALRASSPMEPSACLRLVRQVASALDAAHRLGVVHAGLTPANVLIDAAGDAHVTDFWVPWVLERHGALPGDGGKARRDKYRAPEQVSEGRCAPAAVAAPWLLSAGWRRTPTLGSGEGYVAAPVDSLAVAAAPAARVDTATLLPPAPAKSVPVPTVARVRRPSVAPPRAAHPVPR